MAAAPYPSQHGDLTGGRDMVRTKMNEAEARAAMADLPEWNLESDFSAISRRFTFANFIRAFGFMTQVAIEAEKMDHHPDWSNVYKTVDVKLNTHDAGGLTELDFKLARKMDRLAGG
jgi:4a-hydroxytetrahydrobiopterin dehydratase